jgi:2-haloacid dehalogenase
VAEPRVDAVVFDIGGVVVDWNPRHLYRQVFDDHDDVEQFLATVCTLDWHAQHDAGVPMAETIPDLVAEHPHLAEQIAVWRTRYVEMVAGYVPGMDELVGEIRAAGVPTYALTNMPAEVLTDLVDAYPVMSEFEGMVVSGEELVTKPDPEIFRRLASRFGLDPRRTVFVDDVPANVDAAWTMGFRAVRFESEPQLRRALAHWGVPVSVRSARP